MVHILTPSTLAPNALTNIHPRPFFPSSFHAWREMGDALGIDASQPLGRTRGERIDVLPDHGPSFSFVSGYGRPWADNRR